MSTFIDLRSDTVTKPTIEMRKAMADAEVGDDVYGEDPTVRRLEEHTAELLGKEAGLFVTSGTQGNQVAIATHAKTGEEIIAEAESHIFYYEAGAVSAIAGAQIRQVPGRRGILDPDQVKAAIREPNVHHPRTALISLENTHNRGGGAVIPLATMKAIRDVAKSANVPVHIDGARLFNAAAAAGIPAKAFADCADTVQICLSKGLCAPVGSVLVGSRSFIEAARQWRKRLGGGMRQAGVIAAPGLIALDKMVDRLAEDHENARRFAEHLANIRGIEVDLKNVETNIVIVDIESSAMKPAAFLQDLKDRGVLASSFGGTLIRFVTHHDVSRTDIDTAAAKVTEVMAGVRG